MSILTYNIKLYGEESFVNHWINLLSLSQQAYNACSDMIVSNNLPLSLTVVHNNCYDILRQRFSTLPSQTIIRIQREVLAAFKSKKRNRQNGSAPQKHNMSMTLDKRMYSNFTRDGISIVSDVPNKRKRFSFLLYPKVNKLFATSVAKDPTIFYKDNTLWLSIPFDQQGCMPESITSVGIDMGMKRLFVTSEGKYFADKDYLKERRKLRYLKRCLQSKGTKSAKRHLKHISKKEHNISKNTCYKACNELLKTTHASYLIMEDLTKIKYNTSKSDEGYKRKRHNNAFGQVPFYMFKQILTYKATLVGKQVASVSPCYTSQTDSRTGNKDGKRCGCRFYCSDDIVFDADWNAAVNIAQRSKHPLSTNVLPIDGKLIALSGRVSSTTQTYKNKSFCTNH